MNKDIVDCIRAEKEKEAQIKKEKEEMIQKIKDFFKDLPEGEYHISLVNTIEKRTIDWYSLKSYTYSKNIKKELSWMKCFADNIDIERGADNKVEIGTRYIAFIKSISNWPYDKVKTFYDHLDWFEKELGKEYCKGKQKA